MAGKITTVRIPSTPMKKGVQSTIDLADQAIETGEKILALSKKSLAASIGKGNKAAIRAASSAVLHNQKTLTKAVALKQELVESDKLANKLCQLNVLFGDFRYFTPE